MSGFSIPDLVILSGATESGALSGIFENARAITIWSPDTLPETVTVHSAPESTADFDPHQSGGADITLPAAKATTIDLAGTIGSLKLVAGGAVAADRTFKARLFEDVGPLSY